MHKSENTILIWVLSWACLLLGLLYSPIGSPDLYRHRDYFVENQGVNFNGSGISRGSREISFLKVLKNAPRGITGDQNEDAELDVPTANNNPGKVYNYHVSGTTKSINQTRNVVIIANNHIISGNRTGESFGSGNTSGSTGGGGMNGGGSMTGISRSSRTSQISSDIQSAGIETGVDLSLFGDSTVNHINNKNTQKVNSVVDQTDLGVDQPVPVPEGWSYLLFLALIYCAYILIKKKTLKNKAC